MYADDLVMYSPFSFQVSQALSTLKEASSAVGLEINIAKTQAMKFRKGGRLAKTDRFLLNGSVVPIVSKFCYLGLIIPSNGHSFAAHVKERARKAAAAATQIRTPSGLALKTASALFDMKVSPTATYGIKLIWSDLKISDIRTLDKVKPSFLKRALGVPSTARNTLVYLLAASNRLVEDLKDHLQLPETPAFLDFRRECRQKLLDIGPEFFETPAMLSDAWKGSQRPTRHLVTRAAVHGFHHMLCETSSFHEPEANCRCKFCRAICGRYHLLRCAEAPPLATLTDPSTRPPPTRPQADPDTAAVNTV